MNEDIAKLRGDIDRVDRALLELVGERLQLSARVRDAKLRESGAGEGVWRPAREESLVRELVAAAEVSPPLVSRIWAELVSASLAVQGPMRIHVGLEGDRAQVMRLVRDRFGAALPTVAYPTSSAALAAAGADAEGVAVVPSPGGMNSWWSALCPGGALEHMHILAGLPRIRNADWPDDDWPRAVAVGHARVEPSGADRWLVASRTAMDARLRAEAGAWTLYALDAAPDTGGGKAVIGILPDPLPPA